MRKSEKSSRPIPNQALDERDPPDLTFVHTQFVAFADPQTIRFTRTGSVNITFSVAPEFVDEMLELRNAGGVPLSVDVQVWRPYKIALVEDMNDA